MTEGATHVYELAPASALYDLALVDPLPDPPVDILYCAKEMFEVDGFVPGAEVTGTFAHTKLENLGSGPLRVAVASFGSGSIALDAADEFVMADGRHCHVRKAADGTLRCALVHPAISQHGFEDPECQRPLYGAFSSSLRDDAAHPTWLGYGQYDQTGLVAAYALEPHGGDVYQSGSGRCIRQEPGTSNADEVFYRSTGERTELAEMPIVELRPL